MFVCLVLLILTANCQIFMRHWISIHYEPAVTNNVVAVWDSEVGSTVVKGSIVFLNSVRIKFHRKITNLRWSNSSVEWKQYGAHAKSIFTSGFKYYANKFLWTILHINVHKHGESRRLYRINLRQFKFVPEKNYIQ